MNQTFPVVFPGAGSGNPASALEDAETFIVTRGYRHNCDALRNKLVSEMAGRNDAKEVSSLQLKLNSVHASYDGAFYGNYFKVNRAIDLTGISFFGPWKGKCAEYFVKVDIFQSLVQWPEPTRTLAKLRKPIQVDSELFWVDLDQPLRLLPDIWYTVQFCLEDGPQTFRCEKVLNGVTVPIGQHQSVEFTFLHGSMQMPQLKFKVPILNHYTNYMQEVKPQKGGFFRLFGLLPNRTPHTPSTWSSEKAL